MSWDTTFLNWFSDQKIPVSENSMSLGGLRYYQFTSASAGVRGDEIFSFGCATDRKVAAIKCAAEMMERQFTDRFFQSSDAEVDASWVDSKAEATSKEGRAPLPPAGLKTSNGWAVYSAPEEARTKALEEALERHLLIKSFYRWGWQGFRLIEEIQDPEMHIFFMTSRLLSGGLVSGIVAAKSPLYPGLSFGYCVGRVEDIHQSSFWEKALFEAISKLLALAGRPLNVRPGPHAWLQTETKAYLETPFDLDLLKQGKDLPTEDEAPRSYWIKSFDVATSRQLPFPLTAAYCWGGDLLPLCNPAILDETGKQYFESLLKANSLPRAVPTRHPIL